MRIIIESDGIGNVSLWEPSRGVGELFDSQLRFMEAKLQLESGVSEIESDIMLERLS